MWLCRGVHTIDNFRYFINGGCRLGSRCKYRHERPLSVQLCRYFQKGGCWYGESCRYLHVLQPEGAAVTGRRCSAPAVSPSVAHTAPGRRGSQPAVLPAQMMAGQESRQLQSFAVHVSNRQGDTGQRAEKRPQDSESPLGTILQSEQNLKVSQETVASDATEKLDGAAASSDTRENVAVTCGICMDNVYEKKPPRDNVFGILPNCNHAFCKQCITTWRKMREYGPDVVKSCPQCRVKSAFYVPSKHWVEGQEKERLIAAFRQRCSKKNCQYFTRYRCCPFESECLYLHDKRARWMSPCPTEDDDDFVDPLNLLLALTLLGGDIDDDEEDSLDFPFYLSVEYNL